MVMHSTQFFRRTQGINAEARLQSRGLMRLFEALAKARSAFRSELRARRDAAELASMDDRMLRDIGISRSEINSLVRRPVAVRTLAGSGTATCGSDWSNSPGPRCWVFRHGEHRHNASKAMAATASNSKNVHESS